MKSNMFVPTITMAVIALALFIVAYAKGGGQHISGLKAALNMTVEVLPLLLIAFVVAGLIQAILPRELVSRWIGNESGIKGIFIGSLLGGLTPGGPYVTLPIVAGLFRSGASIPTLVSFMTAWSLWAFARLPMEVGILGFRITMIRVACTFIFPPIAGMIAYLFIGKQ